MGCSDEGKTPSGIPQKLIGDAQAIGDCHEAVHKMGTPRIAVSAYQLSTCLHHILCWACGS